jgi:hypothetical protein
MRRPEKGHHSMSRHDGDSPDPDNSLPGKPSDTIGSHASDSSRILRPPAPEGADVREADLVELQSEITDLGDQTIGSTASTSSALASHASLEGTPSSTAAATPLAIPEGDFTAHPTDQLRPHTTNHSTDYDAKVIERLDFYHGEVSEVDFPPSTEESESAPPAQGLQPRPRPRSRAAFILALVLLIALVGVGILGRAPLMSGLSSLVYGSPVPHRGTATATLAPIPTPEALPTATSPPTATPVPQPTATALPPTPRLSVLAPANNATVTTANGVDPASPPITFQASVSPSGAKVTWTDSVDGLLGTSAIVTHTLSSQHNTNCGGHTPHVVTAKATNVSGAVTASITINVVPFCHS